MNVHATSGNVSFAKVVHRSASPGYTKLLGGVVMRVLVGRFCSYSSLLPSAKCFDLGGSRLCEKNNILETQLH